jgi:hypothetical protein
VSPISFRVPSPQSVTLIVNRSLDFFTCQLLFGCSKFYRYLSPFQARLPLDSFSLIPRQHDRKIASSSSTSRSRLCYLSMTMIPMMDMSTLIARHPLLCELSIRLDPRQVASVLPHLFRTLPHLTDLQIHIIPTMTWPIQLAHGPRHEHNVLVGHAITHQITTHGRDGRGVTTDISSTSNNRNDDKEGTNSVIWSPLLREVQFVVDPPICGAIHSGLATDIAHVVATYLSPTSLISKNGVLPYHPAPLLTTIILDVDPRDRTAVPLASNPIHCDDIIDAFMTISERTSLGTYHSRRCERTRLEKAQRRHYHRLERALGAPDFAYQCSDDDDHAAAWDGKQRTRREELAYDDDD